MHNELHDSRTGKSSALHTISSREPNASLETFYQPNACFTELGCRICGVDREGDRAAIIDRVGVGIQVDVVRITGP